jgi:hypothetical protein
MIDPSDEDGPTAIAAVAADGLYRAAVPRGEGRQLYLFSRSARSYRLFEGLPSVAGGSAHFRQHPLDRGMDILFSCPARQNLFATSR